MEKLFFVETFGCQMNLRDSETIDGILYQIGYLKTDCIEFADIIVLNTCCVRNTAENRIIGRIGDIKPLKEKKRDILLIISGCMTQQKGVAESLLKKFPFIDIVLGTANLFDLPRLINEVLDNRNLQKKYARNHYMDFPNIYDPSINEILPIYRSSWPNAWVNIISGCNNFCSYCIVPYVRGRECSRNPENIIKETTDLLKKGYKEITLLGQNVNSYGNDRNDEWDFNKLLFEIANLDEKFRLRFMTSHPKDLSARVIQTISISKNICKQIHLPLQAGSDKVLKSMNRKYSMIEYYTLINQIKTSIPDVAITTDIMVGFPGETEEDFEQTLQAIKAIRFHSAFMFVYSPRKGTPATNYTQVDNSIKKERITRLIKEQNIISMEISMEYLNKTFEVLVEGHIDDDVYCGRTDNGRLIKFRSKEDLIGKFVRLLVNKNKSSSLWGELI